MPDARTAQIPARRGVTRLTVVAFPLLSCPTAEEIRMPDFHPDHVDDDHLDDETYALLDANDRELRRRSVLPAQRRRRITTRRSTAERASAQGGPMPANCKSCNGPIEWATMPTGKLMPIDATPVHDGNVAARRDERGDLVARVLKDDDELLEGERRGTSHFATCPNAAAHRRPR